jgi:hypothetical protein
MIDVKAAVGAAISYVKTFQELFPTSDVRLEETEFDDNKGEWVITLSFGDNSKLGIRKVKEFRITNTGRVVSMKDRSGISF